MTAPVRSLEVRSSIVTAFRRDLVGPGPQDADLARERLNENPSRWYLAGFLAPADDPLGMDAPPEGADDIGAQEEMEIQAGDQDVLVARLTEEMTAAWRQGARPGAEHFLDLLLRHQPRK